MIGLK
jgi:hypothetical protein